MVETRKQRLQLVLMRCFLVMKSVQFSLNLLERLPLSTFKYSFNSLHFSFESLVTNHLFNEVVGTFLSSNFSPHLKSYKLHKKHKSFNNSLTLFFKILLSI
ncbi:unnamed protein product [Citrullus colocynthis]|uniref:Uncharacterized protein n=1 Tax=Citrullus colocynthis TaxID=252529 RepID=A0ABP0XVP8_9ROSI